MRWAAYRHAAFGGGRTEADALVVVERLVRPGGDSLLGRRYHATVQIQAAPRFALSTGLSGWPVTSVRVGHVYAGFAEDPVGRGDAEPVELIVAVEAPLRCEIRGRAEPGRTGSQIACEFGERVDPQCG